MVKYNSLCFRVLHKERKGRNFFPQNSGGPLLNFMTEQEARERVKNSPLNTFTFNLSNADEKEKEKFKEFLEKNNKDDS